MVITNMVEEIVNVHLIREKVVIALAAINQTTVALLQAEDMVLVYLIRMINTVPAMHQAVADMVQVCLTKTTSIALTSLQAVEVIAKDVVVAAIVVAIGVACLPARIAMMTVVHNHNQQECIPNEVVKGVIHVAIKIQLKYLVLVVVAAAAIEVAGKIAMVIVEIEWEERMQLRHRTKSDPTTTIEV